MRQRAANGAAAVSIYALQRESIAAVLTDMAMPIMDGPAMAVALRAINPEVKIIGSSGLGASGGCPWPAMRAYWNSSQAVYGGDAC